MIAAGKTPVSISAGADNLTNQQVMDVLSNNNIQSLVDQGIGLLNNIMAWDLATMRLDMMENIAELKIEADKEIAQLEFKLGRELLGVQREADERMNGIGGLNERLAELKLNNDLEKHKATLETEKEIAAMQGLDRAFAGERVNPYYGAPYQIV